jgi:hypothetical protein
MATAPRVQIGECANPQCVPRPDSVRLLACTRCYTVRYCCVSCQKAHWTQEHKAQCTSAIEITKNDEGTRGVVATRDIKRDEIFFSEDALLHLPVIDRRSTLSSQGQAVVKALGVSSSSSSPLQSLQSSQVSNSNLMLTAARACIEEDNADDSKKKKTYHLAVANWLQTHLPPGATTSWSAKDLRHVAMMTSLSTDMDPSANVVKRLADDLHVPLWSLNFFIEAQRLLKVTPAQQQPPSLEKIYEVYACIAINAFECMSSFLCLLA